MIDKVKEVMDSEAYSFIGLPLFWWVSILVFALFLLVAAHMYRRKK
ncbi:hypothetical protein ACMDB5_06070 [Flavobacterium sp. W1B]